MGGWAGDVSTIQFFGDFRKNVNFAMPVGDCTATVTLITYLQIVEVRHDISHNMLVTRSDKGEVTLIQFWSLPYLERLTDVVCPLDMIGFIRLVSLCKILYLQLKVE